MQLYMSWYIISFFWLYLFFSNILYFSSTLVLTSPIDVVVVLSILRTFALCQAMSYQWSLAIISNITQWYNRHIWHRWENISNVIILYFRLPYFNVLNGVYFLQSTCGHRRSLHTFYSSSNNDPCSAESGTLEKKWVNTFAAYTLTPWAAKASAAMYGKVNQH